MTHTPEQIQATIESAGKTLCMYKTDRLKPSQNVTYWPEYWRDKLDLLDATDGGLTVIYHDVKLSWGTPSPQKITEMDMVFDWMFDLKAYCDRKDLLKVYKVVWAVMPHHPIGEHQMISFRKIGKVFGKSDRTIRRWYADGIGIIARQQNGAQLDFKGGYSNVIPLGAKKIQ